MTDDEDDGDTYQIKTAQEVMSDFAARSAELLELPPMEEVMTAGNLELRLYELATRHLQLMHLMFQTVNDLGTAMIGISARLSLLETTVLDGQVTASFAPDLTIVPPET